MDTTTRKELWLHSLKSNLSPLPSSRFLTKTPPFPPKTQAKPMDLQSLLAEVTQLRQEVATLKQRSSKKPPCQGVTGKGTPCRNRALAGGQYIRKHSREPKPPKVARTRKEPKPKKTIPEHTHPIGHHDPHCLLCQTHGDCMDPTLPDHTFEGEILCAPTLCGETESV